MMAGIRGSNTKPEVELRRALHAGGLRYRLHVRGLPGKPDIVLSRHRAAIFVHGCFWHRHKGCRYSTTPSTRTEFWQEKFSANVARDAAAIHSLLAAGWRVAVIWECALRPSGAAREIADVLAIWLPGQNDYLEIGQARTSCD